MKSIISMSAITVLAALALVGCNQNSQSTSTEKPSANSSMDHANGMMGGTTNMPATNRMPNMNLPASTNSTNSTNSPKSTGAANDATR